MKGLGRAAGSALRVYDLLRQRIVLSAPRAAGELGLTWPTVNAALRHLERLGIAREATGRSRDRLYVYGRQLELLNGGIPTGTSEPGSG
ncbi:MAG: hypothetical protein ABW277_01785 [Longimicrobiaceae bacterium]